MVLKALIPIIGNWRSIETGKHSSRMHTAYFADHHYLSVQVGDRS